MDVLVRGPERRPPRLRRWAGIEDAVQNPL
jgi:hypothetical protein